MPAHAQPERAASGRPPSSPSPLARLHQRIAAHKIRAEAEQAGATSTQPEQPMVPIFNETGEPVESLCPDGDVKRRNEKILKTLRERGSLRLLGATASETMADSIASLYDSHPNFATAVDYLLGEEILARQRHDAMTGLRLLLHGGAGVGKSDFSLTLAKLLGVPAEVISLSSSQAAAYLAGSEEYWSNSQPGIVWKMLIQGTYANPIFVLDEIDKVANRWGDPLGALYQLLEPKTACIFADKSVPWLRVDASYCNWIATANDIDTIHPALRSRFTEIAVTSPTPESLAALVQRLYADFLHEYQLSGRLPLTLTDDQAHALVGGSIRDAKRVLRAAIAQALRNGESCIRLKAMPRESTVPRIGFIH